MTPLTALFDTLCGLCDTLTILGGLVDILDGFCDILGILGDTLCGLGDSLGILSSTICGTGLISQLIIIKSSSTICGTDPTLKVNPYIERASYLFNISILD